MLCAKGRSLRERYQEAALVWADHIQQRASIGTVERLERESSRSISEFSQHRAVCAICRQSSVVEDSTFRTRLGSEGRRPVGQPDQKRAA
jgi:hypothetical protein